jgi:hypothetical protein
VGVSRWSFIGVAACLGLTAGSRAARAETTVSLAFDGTYLDIAPVQTMLSTRGLHATFFANSAMVGTKDRLSLQQLLDLQKDGNEIGGSTSYGLDLLHLDPTEQMREICSDRSWLLSSGFDVRSFAFPPSSKTDPTTTGAVDFVVQCGYNAARKVAGLACGTTCPNTIVLPPSDPFRLPSLPLVDQSTSLGDLQNYVTSGEQSGGWLIFVMRHLCDLPSGCDPASITSTTLTGFLDWLVTQQETQAIQVQTIGEVIHQPQKAPVAPPAATPPGADGALLQNGSLENDVDGDGLPDCWQAGGEGNNNYVIQHVRDPHDGQWAEQIEISDLTDGARRVVSKQDLGQCAPAATVGHVYRVTAWVKSTGLVKLIAYTRASSGAWSYWAQSRYVGESSDYQQVSWLTPPAPASAIGLSAGVTLDSVGSVTMDQIALEDLGSDLAASRGCSSAPFGTEGGTDAGEAALLAVIVCLYARQRRRIGMPVFGRSVTVGSSSATKSSGS